MNMTDEVVQKLIGSQVRHDTTGSIGIIVDFSSRDRNNYVYVHFLSSGKPEVNSQFQFPAVFLGGDKKITAITEELKAFVKRETKLVCNHCKTYSETVEQYGTARFCRECAKMYKQCCKCGQYVKEVKFGIDGKYRCKKCHRANFPTRRMDFIVQTPAPIVHIQKGYPYKCVDSHKIENICATVACFKRDWQVAEINMHYCTDCQKYFMTEESLSMYERRFGAMMFERKLAVPPKSRSRYWYAEDSLLSRWGYSAAELRYWPEKRRSILVHLMRMDDNNKSEISGLLSTFIWRMGRQHPDIAKIWRSDLEFVNDYDLANQRKVTISTPPQTT